MDPERHTCTWKDEPVTLTVTEFLILQALAARSGVVKSRNALMDAAYDDQVYVDDRTIDSHIKRLRKKFKVGRRRLRHDRNAVRRRLPLQGTLSPSGLSSVPRSIECARRAREGHTRQRPHCSIEPPKPTSPTAETSASRRAAGAFPAQPVRRPAAPRSRRSIARAGCAASRSCAWQFFVSQSFSSLTRRIVSLNVAGLLALVVGILYLSQFRAGLIDARVQSLVVQGEIIAGAIAASATVDTYGTNIDRDRLLELQPGESYGRRRGVTGLEFPINPERVAPVLRRLISPTKTRARIYDRDGYLILDSRNLYVRGDVLRFDLPPPNEEKPEHVQARLDRVPRRGSAAAICRSTASSARTPARAIRRWRRRSPAPRAPTWCASTTAARSSSRWRCRCSASARCAARCCCRPRAATSTRRSRPSGCRSSSCSSSCWASWWCCRCCSPRTIAGPVRRLADGAERVRHRIRSRVEIPDFTARRDEIGDLSGALRDMTNALYSRIEAIESFAADVAHELKNPLTSLRSAVETLPLAKSPDSQQRLLAVIQHDVKRLDRLISDISDASRLDAELQRHEVAPVDLAKLLNTVVTVQNETPRRCARRCRSPSRAAARSPSWCRDTIRGSAR